MSKQSLFPSGAVLRQMRKVAEKKANYQAQPFTSTNRYFRGRIVDHLRSLAAGERISLYILGPKIKPDFCPEDLTWLQKLIDGLVKDGLADCTDDGVRLPGG
jgi:A/G-specific adenine glycosylase